MKKKLSPRERLLKAGIRLFAEKGYTATSVNEIVKATGLAKPALYYYFKSKEELYLAILSYGFDERLRIMKEAFQQNQGWKNQLVAFVRAVLKFAKERRELCRITFQASFAPAKEVSAHLPMRKMAIRNMEYFKKIFHLGIRERFFKNSNPHALALALHGHLLSYVLLQSLNSPLLPKKINAEDIVELFLRGAANGRGRA